MIIVGSENCGFCGKYLVDYLLKIAFGKDIEIEWTNPLDSKNRRPDLIVRCFIQSEPLYDRDNPIYKDIPYITWTGESYPILNPNSNLICNLNSFSEFNNDDNNNDSVTNFCFPFALSVTAKYLTNNNDNLRRFLNSEKQYNVIACFSNPVHNRVRFFTMLRERLGDSVQGIGRACNTCYNANHPGDFETDSLFERYSHSKFVLCMENTVKKGYLTEKLMNAYVSNAIPIYWGDPDTVKKYFNPDSLICINDFSTFELCIDYICEVALNEEKWKHMLSVPIFKDDNARKFFTFNLDDPAQEYIDAAKSIKEHVTQ